MACADRPFGLKALFGLLIVLSLTMMMPSSAHAGDPHIWVRVGDTTATAGEKNTVISVYMDNYLDVIGGFNIILKLGAPNIIEFQVDTIQVEHKRYWICNPPGSGSGTCADSTEVDSTWADSVPTYDWVTTELLDIEVGNVDTTGTLISGWEFLDPRATASGQILTITGFADLPAAPITPGIGIQSGGLLFKVLADVFPLADNDSNRTVDIQIIHENPRDDLVFSNGLGDTVIGLHTTPILDSNCWTCLQWAGDSCLNAERTNDPSLYDWCDTSTIYQGYLDTTEVIPTNGQLSVDWPPPTCCVGAMRGNANGDFEDKVNISDITFLTSFLFGIPQGPAPICMDEADANGDLEGKVNISDITRLTGFLFGIPQGEPPAPCP